VVATVIASTSHASGLPTEAGYLAGFAVIGSGMLAAAAVAALFRAEEPPGLGDIARDLPDMTARVGEAGGTHTPWPIHRAV